MQRTRDFSSFNRTASAAPVAMRARRTSQDDVTAYLKTIGGMNVVMKIGLPSVLAIVTATQLSAGIASTVEQEFGALAPIMSALIPENPLYADDIVIEAEPDLGTLFSHLNVD